MRAVRATLYTNVVEAEWIEELHPRAKGGKFGLKTKTTGSDLNEKDRGKYDAILTKYQLTHEAVVAEIMNRIAPGGTADTALMDQARAWYPEAHQFAEHLTTLAPISIEQAAGAISACSPQNAWERLTQFGPAGNKRDAEYLVRYFAEHQDEDPKTLMRGFRSMMNIKEGGNNDDRHLGPGLSIGDKDYTKAFKILTDGSQENIQKTLGTLKTASFYNNIMAPGQTRDVTVDGHMAKAPVYAGQSLGIGTMPKDGPTPGEGRLGSALSLMDKTVWGSPGHVLIADATRAVADKIGESPDTVQAAYWLRVQPLNPWGAEKASRQDYSGAPSHDVLASKFSGEVTDKKSSKREAATKKPFLVKYDPSMEWGDGMPLTDAEFEKRVGAKLIVREAGDWDEQKHPRGEHGRFGAGSGGAKADDEKGKPAGKASCDKPECIRTDDIEEAAKALGEGKDVVLSQPEQVSTLLEKLAAIAKEAQEKGEQAPNYDLCKVSVPGTNLFCLESKGIPRVEMPQFIGKPAEGSPGDKLEKGRGGEVDTGPGFLDYMKGKGVGVESTTEDPAKLRATQNELNGVKVGGIMGAMAKQDKDSALRTGALFVSKDNYVVDGHHRWAALVGLEYKEGKQLSVNVHRVDMGITELLKHAHEYTRQQGIATADWKAKEAHRGHRRGCECGRNREASTGARLPKVRRVVDMVEGGVVVVRHIFYGDDPATAKHMEQAHREADASLDASMNGKPYKGTAIKAVRQKEAKDELGHGSYSKGERPEIQHPAAKHMPATYELNPKDEKPAEAPRKFRGLYDDDDEPLREVQSSLLTTPSVVATLREGGKGSGIVSHINPALTAEARTSYEGGRGSNQYRVRPGGRSKFAPEDHEPAEQVRVETPAVRAERFRSMRISPVRAEIVRRAIGMRATLA